MAATFGPFLVWVAVAPPTRPLPDLRTMGFFAVAGVVQMLLLAAGWLWLRIASPTEAIAPPDERDRAIARRSVSAAYNVLIAGMIVVGCVMPFNSGGWTLVSTAVAAIVLAQTVHYGLSIWCYRRGWHD
ncbi:hypothetical protein KBY92_12490 [Synechococcus sp. Cruz CV-v-12]|nr:hypothetical protein [Synechococcus sp. Cruz CV-v-12]